MFFIAAGCRQTATFPITDLHVHLKGDFGIEDAVRKSEAENIQYGIALNCGLGFPVQNDSQVDAFLLIMDIYRGEADLSRRLLPTVLQGNAGLNVP